MTEKLSQKENTRKRIVDEAAKAMRRHGSQGIGVAGLMKLAGLTHGGFYGHFRDRDDLVAQAVDRMLVDNRTLLDRTLGNADPVQGLTALIDRYLSMEMRSELERSCPLTSVSQEAGRMPLPAREALESGIRGFADRLAAALAGLDHDAGDDDAGEALPILSEMVGAMTLARAIADDAEAANWLGTSRRNLKRRLRLPLA